MNRIQWTIRNPEQLANFIQMAHQWPMPFQGILQKPVHPKTTSQIRYAHSLCNALAIGKGASLEAAKTDAKREFGVIKVGTSLVTGDRMARLVSFADYTREEMTAFCTSMEVYLSEQGIPFHASEGEDDERN